MMPTKQPVATNVRRARGCETASARWQVVGVGPHDKLINERVSMLFLTMRALHVVLAAAWFGAVLFTTLFLGPAVDELGPSSGPLMNSLMRRGLHKYMASIGGLTVLIGFYLFW